MTTLTVDASDALGTYINDGVVRLSAAGINFDHGSVVLPEFQEKALYQGKTTFYNVQPGKVVVQFYWDKGRTATVRVTVPPSGTVSLSNLMLQIYDKDPVIVSQITTAATDVDNALKRIITLESSAESSADKATTSRNEALAFRNQADNHADAAQGHSRTSAEYAVRAETAYENVSEAQEIVTDFAADAEESANAAANHERDAGAHALEAGTARDEAEAAAAQAAGSEQASDQNAEATRIDREATAGHVTETAADRAFTATARQATNWYAESAMGHWEKARAESEAATAMRDGAKTHREAAKISEDNAAASAASAKTDYTALSGLASDLEEDVQTATAAVEAARGIEADLRALMADTEAWNDLQTALEAVDADIAAGMEQVKNDILGGVGPAFDTLLELAEAFGENRDAIVEITDQLSKKAEKGHTHTSADITNATSVLHGNYPDQVVKTRDDGQIYVYTSTVTKSHSVANKGYVDGEVAKKADTSHTHTIANVSGLQTALNGKSPTNHIHAIKDVDGLDEALAERSSEGHTHAVAEIRGLRDELDGKADQQAVDEALSPRGLHGTLIVDPIILDDAGVTIMFPRPATGETTIRMDYSSEVTGNNALVGYMFRGPDGEKALDGMSGLTYSTSIGEPYRYIYVHEDARRVWSHTVTPDEGWTLDGIILRSWRSGGVSGAGKVKVHAFAADDGSDPLVATRDFYGGIAVPEIPVSPASATSRKWVVEQLGGKADQGHKHVSEDITDSTSSTGRPDNARKVVRTDVDGHIYSYTNPTHASQLARKGYVDGEVAKKANTSHTHRWNDIDADARTNFVGNEENGTKYILTQSDGWFKIKKSATDWDHPTNKGYVDQEVSKKADATHTHTVSQLTDYPGHSVITGSSAYGKIPVRESSSDAIRVGTIPTERYHAASKMYVDDRIQLVTSWPTSPVAGVLYLMEEEA